MNNKQVLKYAAAALVGTAIGALFMWRSATIEHARLMNIYVNKDIIESIDGVSAERNMRLQTKNHTAAIAECKINSEQISQLNRFEAKNITSIGWKSYIRGGALIYLASDSASKDMHSIFVCIIDRDGDLETTRFIYPKLDGDPIVAIHRPSFLEISF